MPIIRVEMLPGRTIEQKRAFAQSVTDTASEILGCSREAVAVVFDEIEPTNWADGGRLISDTSGKAS